MIDTRSDPGPWADAIPFLPSAHNYAAPRYSGGDLAGVLNACPAPDGVNAGGAAALCLIPRRAGTAHNPLHGTPSGGFSPKGRALHHASNIRDRRAMIHDFRQIVPGWHVKCVCGP